MNLPSSAAQPNDTSEEDHEISRREWFEIAKGYAVIAGAAGVACLGLSLYLRDPSVMVDWLHCAIAIPVFLCMITALWIITVWPILLLVAVLVARCETPKNFRRDGPGIYVCR